MESMEHEVWLDAPADAVFAALTTKEGLDRWWGPVTNAEARVDSVVEFDHGLGAPLQMEITELVPNERVTWRCISAFSDPSNPASEWRGQELRFDLAPYGEVELLGTTQKATVLRLRITGWPANARWYGFCNAAWGQTLNERLKNSLSG
jgi:uncharacterized protein YndB with AHSA1/START domain